MPALLRLCAPLALVVTAAVGGLSPLPADAASPVAAREAPFTDTGKTCNPKKYDDHFTLRVARNAPEITHVSNYVFGPHYDRTTTKTSSYNETVTSGWHAEATVKAESGGLSRLVTKAEGTIGGGYQKSKSHTETGSISVTDHIKNPTSHNQQWVFYKGVMAARGSYRWYQCHQFYVDGQSYGYYHVVYWPGTWRTYAVSGGGAASCSAGTDGLGAIAKAAMKIGCAA